MARLPHSGGGFADGDVDLPAAHFKAARRHAGAGENAGGIEHSGGVGNSGERIKIEQEQ